MLINICEYKKRLVETPKCPRQNRWAHKHVHDSREIVVCYEVIVWRSSSLCQLGLSSCILKELKLVL